MYWASWQKVCCPEENVGKVKWLHSTKLAFSCKRRVLFLRTLRGDLCFLQKILPHSASCCVVALIFSLVPCMYESRFPVEASKSPRKTGDGFPGLDLSSG